MSGFRAGGMLGRWYVGAVVGAAVLGLSACAGPPKPREVSAGHLDSRERPAAAQEIPEPVQRTPFVPEPEPRPPEETYTVVVDRVPVGELLFALARDAERNVDIHPDVTGQVTLNAVDQTLFQILDRIARQVDMRYEVEDGTIVISPDRPFLRTYTVDYVNMARESTGTVETSTGVTSAIAEDGGGGAGGQANTSSTTVNNTSNHRFWETLTSTLNEIVSDGGEGEGGQRANVIANPESGVVLVRASSAEHEQVQSYLDRVLGNAHRQVLIEATVVEVTLNDDYQSGIDFSVLAEDSGVDAVQNLNRLTEPSAFLFNFLEQQSAIGTVDITVEFLQEFGEVKVLSSPKILALNNQTAILKVVDNEVFFEVTFEEEEDEDNGEGEEVRVESEVRTVAVGLVMNVTPQIDDADSVTLNVRPTITRILRFVEDPGAAIAARRIGAADIPPNLVPVVQVRETETVLRVNSGQIAVLGGLMQDRVNRDEAGIPIISNIPRIGEAFKSRNNQFEKTELVIFLRPLVVRNPSIEADFRDFRQFLPENLGEAEPLTIPGSPL